MPPCTGICVRKYESETQTWTLQDNDCAGDCRSGLVCRCPEVKEVLDDVNLRSMYSQEQIETMKHPSDQDRVNLRCVCLEKVPPRG